MLPYPNKTHICLGAQNSLFTGNPWYVGDAARLTVSISSSDTVVSKWTLIGSLADGLTSTLSSANPTVNTVLWSILTTITKPGMYTLDPNVRWINAIREDASTASKTTVIFSQSY